MKSIYSLVLGGSVVWLFVACDQQTSQRSGDFVSQPDPTAGPVEQGSQIRSKPGYKVMISEFLAVNDSITQDGQGQFSDWIELYNYGEEAVNLAGFSLTDDALNSSKWRFPERLLPAGDFLVVFASGEGGETLGELHCSFRLASEAMESVPSGSQGKCRSILKAILSLRRQGDGMMPSCSVMLNL